MLGGYMGRVLRVDLTTRRMADETIPEAMLRAYIGGSGLGARLLFDETTRDTDPLGPENRLLFLTGPLTGVTIPTSGRHAVIAKSPLGIWGEADCGGTFGHELKRAGIDGILVEGQADRPVYLLITDGAASLEDGRELWGRDTFETQDALRARHGERFVVTCIGPGGEKLAPIAAIMNDGRNGRPAARGGLGAVMGSKRLKAIAVAGTARPRVVHDDKLRPLVKQMTLRIKERTAPLRNYGTAGGVLTSEAIGDLAIQNWRRGTWRAGAEKLSGEAMAETILTGRYFCKACTIGCGREIEITDGPYAGVKGAGPEYETLGGLGSMCLVDDLQAVAKANELCNRYGIDTISTGAIIAFAMEAFERGLLRGSDTEGLDLTWGNADTVVRLVEKIGKREGIGDLLGNGVRFLARHWGGEASTFAVEVKGLELAYHDPRALSSLAAAYATYSRGACHRSYSHYLERNTLPELGFEKALDRHATERKGVAAAVMQDYGGLYNSLKLCQFIMRGVSVQEVVDCLNHVTGWEMDLAEFLRAGERASNLKRLYNLRLGMSRKDDTLPPRILTEALPDGGAANYLPNLEAMLDEYYAYRGWTQDGIPTRAKLEALGLGRDGASLGL
ncbi:MAG TPA: aldehyde ferredoxin oxidoreductase family protein [Candidatus Methylomirabilis sp.]|nr:aldehyde ferredoxin oxidoreductase family protein [Candidatus Methylomirabilis sp.]